MEPLVQVPSVLPQLAQLRGAVGPVKAFFILKTKDRNRKRTGEEKNTTRLLEKCLPRKQPGHKKHIEQSSKLSRRGGEEEVVRLSRGEEVRGISIIFPAFSDSVCGAREHAEEATGLSFGGIFHRYFPLFSNWFSMLCSAG